MELLPEVVLPSLPGLQVGVVGRGKGYAEATAVLFALTVLLVVGLLLLATSP